MKIVITGVAGFIGSNLADKLIQEHEIVGIDSFDSFYSREIKESNLSDLLGQSKFSFIPADIRDANQMNEVFSSHCPNLVIHLAAKAGVRPSIQDPIGYYETNVMGTLNLLEAMRLAGVKKMIFASSSSVYGNNLKVPFSENDSVDNPISPYAATKKAGELLCHTYHHLHGFDISCLRFFTVYGPRQRPDLAIHKFTRALCEGTEIPFYGDGFSFRDYTYIDDIIDGITLSLSNLDGYRIYNLGESTTISLQQMIAILEKNTQKKAVLKRLPMQPGDVLKTYADITKAKNQLGYSPKWDFEEGIKEFIKWYRVNHL